jgi:hypothetical protein
VVALMGDPVAGTAAGLAFRLFRRTHRSHV